MIRGSIFVGALCMILFLPWGVSGAEEEVPLQIRPPIELDEMGAYEEVLFRRENLARIERGMTEEEVLFILGKPLTMEKQSRPRNRWTVQYYYPQEVVVNFKHGRVVGKIPADP
jgi:hypothetical protein